MKKGKIWIIIGLLLVAAAVCIILYNIIEDNNAKEESSSVLAVLESEIPEDAVPEEGIKNEDTAWETVYPDYVVNPDISMPIINIDGVDYVGVLNLESLGIRLPVANECTKANLKNGPCLYCGTAYLDNMVICGHNYRSVFGRLRDLSYRDYITFTDMDGNVFRYIVTEIVIIKPDDYTGMTTGDWDMTLFTCTIGGATRVTVRCEKV